MRRAPTVASRVSFRVLVSCLALWTVGVPVGRADESTASIETGGEMPAWREHLAGELALAVGFDYSRGDYGEPDDTDIAYWPISVGYTLDELLWTPLDDQLSLRLTVPLLRVRAPGDVVVGPDGDFVSSGGGGRETEFGLGDVSVRAGYILYPHAESWLPIAELSSRVKIPTADESRGLGTGKTDVSVEVDLSRGISRFVVFAAGARRFAGGNRFHDTWSASVGAGVQIVDGVSAGLIYDWREASSRGTSDSHELVPYAMLQLPAWLGLQFGPYGVVGLSDGSPRWGVGAQLQWRIGLR